MAARGVLRLRRCVRPNAFGNALGSSIAEAASSGSYQGEGTARRPYVTDAGEQIVFNNTAPANNFARVDVIMASAPDWGNAGLPEVDRSNDVLVAAGNRLTLTGVTSDADDDAYYAGIIAKAQARDLQRSAELARRNNWIINENAVGSAVQFKLGTAPIRETEVPIGLSIAAPGFVASEPLSMAAEAAQVATESAIRVIAEVPLMAVDLVQAAGGVAYTEATGKPADLTMYSGMGRAAQAGATMSESLHSLNPVYGLMVGGYEVQRGLEAGDTCPVRVSASPPVTSSTPFFPTNSASRIPPVAHTAGFCPLQQPDARLF